MTAVKFAPAAAAAGYAVEWTSVDALARQKDRWRSLCDAAVEPNPFYSPEYLLSSARDIEKADIRCMAIYRSDAPDAELVGLFPAMRGRISQGAFIPSMEFYQNPYICSTAPLVHRDDPVAICGRFLDSFESEVSRPRTVISRLMPAGRPAAQALKQALAERGFTLDVVSSYVRAAVDTPLGHEAYLAGFSANRRKDLRRRLRRLEEKGAVSFRTVRNGPDLRAALDEFLRVEASGWKRQAGTAMDCAPETRRMAEIAFLGPDSEIDLMALDGRAIAVCSSIVTQGVKYTVKTAFDEVYRACSPSVLLDHYMLDQFTAGGRLVRADSCALPGHLVESLWQEKEKVDFCVFANHPAAGPARVRSLASTLRNFERLKSWMKQQLAGRE